MAVNPYHLHYHKHKKIKPTSAIDTWVYFAVIFGPIMTVPQLYDIWILKQTGISVISWAAYLITACVWLAYGLKHRDKPIIAVQSLWLLFGWGGNSWRSFSAQ